MRKFLCSLILVMALWMSCPIVSDAQVFYYRTTEMSYKYLNKFGHWRGWTKWEPTEFLVVMNFDGNMVKVFSPDEQTYKITEYVKEIDDQFGGRQIKMKIVDQDNDKGIMRVRVDSDGKTQVFIEFKSLMWAYKLEKQEEKYVRK